MILPTNDERKETRTLYIIDDSSTVRISLHHLCGAMGIDAHPFQSGTDFLDGLEHLKPAPILIDLRMPDIDGLELMSELRRRDNAWPVIMMTGHGEVPIAVKAMRLGAVEFLSKPFQADAFESALDLAFESLQDKVAEEQTRTIALVQLATLTQREQEIVRALAIGLTNKESARLLDLSVRTVEMHRANAMRKLSISNVVELIALMTAAGGKPDALGLQSSE